MHTKMAMYKDWIISHFIDHMNSFIESFFYMKSCCLHVNPMAAIIKLPAKNQTTASGALNVNGSNYKSTVTQEM